MVLKYRLFSSCCGFLAQERLYRLSSSSIWTLMHFLIILDMKLQCCCWLLGLISRYFYIHTGWKTELEFFHVTPFNIFSILEFQKVIRSPFVLVRNPSCVITYGRRDRIAEAQLVADLKKLGGYRKRWIHGDKLEREQWRAEKDRQAKRETPDRPRPSFHFASLKLYTSAIYAPQTAPPSASRLSLFTPRSCLIGIHKAKPTHKYTATK